MKSQEGKQIKSIKPKDWNTTFSLFALLKTAYAHQQTISTLWLDSLARNTTAKSNKNTKSKKTLELARQHRLVTDELDDMCQLLELRQDTRLRPVSIQSVFDNKSLWRLASSMSLNTMVICDQRSTSIALSILVKYLSGSRSYTVNSRKRGTELVVTLVPSKRSRFRIDDLDYIRAQEKLSSVTLLPKFSDYIVLYSLELLDHQNVAITLQNKQGSTNMYITFPVSAQLNVFGKN